MGKNEGCDQATTSSGTPARAQHLMTCAILAGA